MLKKRGLWKQGDRVQGLRKTKPTFERILHDLIQRLLAAYQQSLKSGGYPYLVFLMAL